ncbi:MAG: hypothetical protein ACRD1G_13260, partial [Acidimicrobiales bacterium]
EYLPAGTPFELVDVGAGAGLLGEFLSRDRPLATYRFVEPIESLRQRLRTEYGKPSDAGDLEQYASAQFVALLDVLEHQEGDRDFMRRLVDRMVPDSTLLLTVPALQRLWSGWDVSLGHFRRYDKATLLGCIDGLPLKVNEMCFLFPEMVPLGMLRARRSALGTEVAADGQSEFPNLPRIANDLLYGLGSVSLKMRRRWTVGTSLFMSATVSE